MPVWLTVHLRAIDYGLSTMDKLQEHCPQCFCSLMQEGDVSSEQARCCASPHVAIMFKRVVWTQCKA